MTEVSIVATGWCHEHTQAHGQTLESCSGTRALLNAECCRCWTACSSGGSDKRCWHSGVGAGDHLGLVVCPLLAGCTRTEGSCSARRNLWCYGQDYKVSSGKLMYPHKQVWHTCRWLLSGTLPGTSRGAVLCRTMGAAFGKSASPLLLCAACCTGESVCGQEGKE